MTTPAPSRPRAYIPGLVPTLNHRGFMAETLDAISLRFAADAGALDAEVLDMGCAYGIATRAALDHGARVMACDMEEGHVRILEQEVPADQRSRLRTAVGSLPDVDFPDGSFGAILASRVVHFLLPDELRLALAKMRNWLRPGGRLYVIADSPYTGFWSAMAPAFEARKAAGEEWPSFIADIRPYLGRGDLPDGMLPYLNPLDPDTLARECARAGLRVEEARYLGRSPGAGEGERNHAGVIARRESP